MLPVTTLVPNSQTSTLCSPLSHYGSPTVAIAQAMQLTLAMAANVAATMVDQAKE